MDGFTRPAELKTGDWFMVDGMELVGMFEVLAIEPCEGSLTCLPSRQEPHNRYRAKVNGVTSWACAYDVHLAS